MRTLNRLDLRHRVSVCPINVKSDFYGSRCRRFIIQGEYLVQISGSPAKKSVMLGVREVSGTWGRDNT